MNELQEHLLYYITHSIIMFSVTRCCRLPAGLRIIEIAMIIHLGDSSATLCVAVCLTFWGFAVIGISVSEDVEWPVKILTEATHSSYYVYEHNLFVSLPLLTDFMEQSTGKADSR